MMRRLRNELTALPGLMRLGLLIFASSGLLDIVYHVAPFGWGQSLDMHLGHGGSLVHRAIFVGMAIIMLGLFTMSFHREHRAGQ